MIEAEITGGRVCAIYGDQMATDAEIRAAFVHTISIVPVIEMYKWQVRMARTGTTRTQRIVRSKSREPMNFLQKFNITF